jgi:hypothetical protein
VTASGLGGISAFIEYLTDVSFKMSDKLLAAKSEQLSDTNTQYYVVYFLDHHW